MSPSKKPKKPTKFLASDPEEVALRPATPLAEFSVGGSSDDGAALLEFEGDLLVLGLFEEDLVKKEEKDGEESEDEDSPKKPKFPLSGPAPPCAFAAAGAAAVDASLSGLLTDLALDSDFSAKAGSSAFIRVPRAIVSASDGKQKIRYRSVGLVGLGSTQAATGDKMWGKSPFAGLGSAVAAAAKQHKAISAGIAVFNGDGVDGRAAAEGVAKGLGVGAYESSRFKHGPAATRVSGAELFFPSAAASSSPAELLAGAAEGGAVASGVLLARYLVEAPPNVCTPRHLARAAESVAAAAPDVFAVEIFGQKACEEMNMGAFLGVSACSALEPQLIHLTYTPPGFEEGGDGSRDVALVGKGLTFDSGGYNLKVGNVGWKRRRERERAGSGVREVEERGWGGREERKKMQCVFFLISASSLSRPFFSFFPLFFFFLPFKNSQVGGMIEMMKVKLASFFIFFEQKKKERE